MLDHLNGDFPPLYTHRRAATKRIFPSLYDMFVGGVSLADEPPELTARREVAEELGLTRALEATDALSEPILDCVVCTNLNRCFVTLFSYTMNTNEEEVSWQEEEVAWGDFVPYPIIVAAADRSIQRFAEKKEWPGTYLPIQSEPNGSRLKGLSYEGETWMEWDFVPDGLLVWEAWLKKLEKERTTTTVVGEINND
jgi:8-oxo-dGTP pyrophosphatase MutT (NUDIX family)